MPFEIHRTLMLSTSHLAKSDLGIVEETSSLSGEHGWLIYVFMDIEPKAAPSLAAAVALAIREKCDFVRFDSDGPVVDELPSYAW